MVAGAGKESAYPIEQSEEEMRRLALQAQVLHDEPTRWLLDQAGIAPGMRVLDVGCGAGDVAFLAADLVGPSGAVVGVDSSSRAVDTARARAARAGLIHVSFATGDLRELEIEGGFVRCAHRSVGSHVPPGSGSGAPHSAHAHSAGGVVAFREVLIVERPFEAYPTCELLERFAAFSMEHLAGAYRSLGIDGQVGLRLHQVFRDAGLPGPHIWLHAPIGGEPDWPGWEYLGQQMQLISATAGRVGIAFPSEFDPTTFAERVKADVLKQHGVLRLQRGVQAWAHKADA
jgi:SAM-dependent methyltransferase